MTVIAALTIFPLLMAFAASSDLFTMTISNRVCLMVVLGFVVMALLAGMSPQTILLNLSCGAVILVVTFTFFARGWIGGGDAKLAAATALWLGWSHVFEYGVVASLFGGALTLGLLQARRLPLPAWAGRQPWLARLHEKTTGIPYGIALAAAGLVLYPETQLWLRSIQA